jgi:tetratricopeptide (TPR) repeat protein
MNWRPLQLFLFLCLVVPAPALGHGPIHEQIEEVTLRIQRDPRNAELHLKRAELNRIHNDWRAALSDYRTARRLDPTLDVVDFCEGRMLLEAGDLKQARRSLERFLSRHPDDPDALWARARVEAKLRRHKAAVEDYTRALARLSEPKPEHFVERASALAAAGRTTQAIAGLDEGIQRLGPLVTLEIPAIDFELELSRYDAALARLARIIDQSPRKESWLARRGEILARAGREQEAREAFVQALKALEALPPQFQATRAMKELEKQCRASLGNLRTVFGQITNANEQ